MYTAEIEVNGIPPLPLQEMYEYHRLMQFEDLLNGFGLPKLQKTTMRRRRGQWWGDPEEDAMGWCGEETLGCNQL